MSYLHTYSEEEQERLHAQNDALGGFIYQDISISSEESILEIGCGTGAQTKELLRRYSPKQITAVDIEPEQVSQARKKVKSENVTFIVGDFNKILNEEKFDVVFLCWVLEHVPNPDALLKNAKRFLKSNGRIIITEVFNSSLYISPKSPAIETYFNNYNTLQKKFLGHPDIGVKIGNLLSNNGYKILEYFPIVNHQDARNVEKKNNLLEYWEDLILSAKTPMLENGLTTPQIISEVHSEFEKLRKDEQSIFYYHPFRAVATI